MIVGSISASFFTLTSLLTEDHCVILDYTETVQDTAGVSMIYPSELVPVLNTCLFSDDKNVASILNIQTQTESIELLHSDSQAYITASTSIAWDSAAWTNYITQLDTWQLRPSQMTFSAPDDNPDIV